MSDEKRPKKLPPAKTVEGRENQMIALAVDLAEKQLRDGTASSQVISHFLKLGTIREQKEMEMLDHEIELMKAKTEALASTQRVEELYMNALKAMKIYQGDENDEDQNISEPY